MGGRGAAASGWKIALWTINKSFQWYRNDLKRYGYPTFNSNAIKK